MSNASDAERIAKLEATVAANLERARSISAQITRGVSCGVPLSGRETGRLRTQLRILVGRARSANRELRAALKPSQTVIDIRQALEYAPADSGPLAPGLLGWWTPDGYFVCASCAGRIFRRGLALPKGSKAAWTGEPFGVCVGHE